MQAPKIKTTEKVVPMIYAYTTPEIARHDGWTKIGYTEQDVEKRIGQQTNTADVTYNLEWKGNAVFDDGSGETFKDTDFHSYMRKNGVEQEEGKNNEWFHITGPASRNMFYDFRSDHGILKNVPTVKPYTLRKEQEMAVAKTLKYKDAHENGEFLWNAKPRFGKTLAVYDFCKRAGAKTVLVVTNRPAIANSWYQDYMQFMGPQSGYCFVSEVSALKGRKGVMSRSDYINAVTKADGPKGCIEFVSLQDMKGSMYFSTNGIDKLVEVANMTWDVLVIDEAHEGVDTYKTDVAFDRIKRHFTLHLSGTPFKALANSKFPDDAIFNWTYADEQKAKEEWDESQETENPYAVLPQLNLFTYQMSEIVREELKRGIEIQGETEEYAFDLNEFFRTNNGKFVYSSSVDKFLDALTMQKKFPFSTEDLRSELKHTFWLLDRVDSARALAKKLQEHPVFKDYEIILAAGDGKIDDADESERSYDKVVDAIKKHEKTITLSVGQLTVGVTIPEWTGVLILSNIKSPALYMQAAFRAQNPCLFTDGSSFFRKENAYVFDFDPARTLTIYEEFANDLTAGTAAGRGSLDDRKDNIKTLLNFFPVIGEDEDGELIELDAEKVLTIPRKIRSVEVVRRGFMSNFLFQNISQVFGAPQEVMKIIEKFEPPKESKGDVHLAPEVEKDLFINKDGEVDPPDEYVVGTAAEIFGDKITDVTTAVTETVERAETEQTTPKNAAEELKEAVRSIVREDVVDKVKDTYAGQIKASDERRIERQINEKTDRAIDKQFTDHEIEKGIIEKQREEAMQARHETGRTTEDIDREFDAKQEEEKKAFQDKLNAAITTAVEEQKKEAVKTVEKTIKEKEKRTIEDGIRDHLRGFSRTIPSFLMAYGENEVTLATFDGIVPGGVFKEVTSITLDEFRFLRDGGDYTDDETGEEKHFAGQLFDPVVFDDSVKEFLSLKKKLANYFDEKAIEDIFDYIPPQKTNQIFTPKMVVKRMVDSLEEENPGCFDDPDNTFIDLYMKSGLYITEIVKRLFQSERMKQLFPDDKARLRHIFEKQVYGLAPTEIIYKIAVSFILGFSEDAGVEKHNLRKADALPYAKEGRLQELLDELFGE